MPITDGVNSVLEHHFDEPDPIAFVFKEPTMTINFLSDAGLF